MWSFCDWIISVCIMFPRLIHVVAGLRILRPHNIPLYIYIIFCLSTHPSGDTGYSYLPAIVSNSAVDMGVQVCLLLTHLGSER